MFRQDTADDMKRAEDLTKVPEDARFRPVALHVHGDYTTVRFRPVALHVHGDYTIVRFRPVALHVHGDYTMVRLRPVVLHIEFLTLNTFKTSRRFNNSNLSLNIHSCTDL